MLPVPITLFGQRGGHSSHRRPLRQVILTRSRLTNLGVLILTLFAALSSLLNLYLYVNSPGRDVGDHEPRQPQHVRVEDPASVQVWTPLGISSTISRRPEVQALDHLVVVPGHAIWLGPVSDSRLDDGEWILESFQRSGSVAAFIGHIERGLEIASNDRRALLVFSGGQTRQRSTTTEAESYLRLAYHIANLTGTSPPTPTADTLTTRSTTEDHALDSYQNLLFSIARFHEFTGRFPQHVTVVGYEMKRRRFTELHRAAIRWPEDRFAYIGLEIQSDNERLQAQKGEHENGYMPFLSDTYGCHSTLLAKRRLRNPFARYHPYYTSCPQLRRLFDWCPGASDGGSTALYPGSLPWSLHL